MPHFQAGWLLALLVYSGCIVLVELPLRSTTFYSMWVGAIVCSNVCLCSCLSQEMYPPKVHQFAYVTDEACTEDEILSMEIIIMKVNDAHLLDLQVHDSQVKQWQSPTACLLSLTQELKWSLSPQTPISWLNVYMQVAYLKETDELLIPRYPQATFTQIAEVCCAWFLFIFLSNQLAVIY